MPDENTERTAVLQTTQKNNAEVPTPTHDIQSLIHTIRGCQVILDEDLALLYQVETKSLNRAMKRNIERFPADFCFQLTGEEALRCHTGTSNEGRNGRGGRRYLPYAFTEQGIAMLSSVLRTDVAVSVSIGIMRAFVEMRKFLAENSHLIERITSLEEKQILFQTETESKFSRVFQYIEDHAESVQKLFFEGQIYDAFSFLSSLVEKAENSIILIDNFVNIETLNVLSKKRPGTVVEIYTQAGCPLTNADISQFNKQYPDLQVHITKVFHDRFLIIDNKAVYHIGASLKDAGKKCFAVSAMKDENLCSALIEHLQAF